MKKVKVNIIGCDDTTIFNLSVNESEFKFLEKISKISINTSQYDCQPVIEFEEVKE